MNKKIYVYMGLLLSVGLPQVSAQSETQAIELASQHQTRGSSRYQALSGAMGAMGGDFSAIHQNPASMAYYRSSDKVSITGSYTGLSGRSLWNGNAYTESNSLYNVDQLSYMKSWTTGSGAGVTFGFGMHNNGRLRRSLNASTPLAHQGGYSLADYASAVLNNQRTPIPAEEFKKGFAADAPWLGILAYESGWINYDKQDKVYGSAYAFTDTDGTHVEGPREAGLIYNERGSITNYDLALGFRPSSIFSIGATLTFSYLDYTLGSSYSESFRQVPQTSSIYGLSLDNNRNIYGSGIRFSLGVILEPLDGLRLGAAIYTPTLYNLKIDHRAQGTGLSPGFSQVLSVQTPNNAADAFGLRTPWRFTASGAYVFGRRAILALDYEYSNLSGTRLGTYSDESGYQTAYDYKMDNDAIREDFGFDGQHTLRIGLEVNATNRFALRGGYRLTTAQGIAPELSADHPKVEALVPGLQVHYRLPGAISSFSLGMGYKLSPSWTVDVSYTHLRQDNKVYAYPFIKDRTLPQQDANILPPSAIKDEQTHNHVSMTLSYKF